MKKYKYQTLTSKEKKEACNKYFSTKEGNELKIRLNRLLIYSIILIVFGLYLIIEAIVKGSLNAQLVYGILVIVCSVIFLIGRYYLKLKNVNNYIVKKK